MPGKIRDDMPMAQAALIGCGVTTSGNGDSYRPVEAGSTVAVIGCVDVAYQPLTALPLLGRRAS